MTTHYDPIAEQYKRSKLQPWRTHVESYTLERSPITFLECVT